MTEAVARQGPLAEYLGHFDRLIGDKRTRETFGGIVQGIINGGSQVCQRIAAHSTLLSKAKDGGERVMCLAIGH